MAVYIVSLKEGRVVGSIDVPDTATMNGMAALPRHPHILLSADSIAGRILSIDTRTIPPIGINGLRTREDYIYFMISSQGTFVRVRIDEHGNRIGDFEVLARSPDASQIYDDFTFDDDGNAYVAVHSSSIVKITSDGVQTTLVGGTSDLTLQEPTSVALAKDGKSIYVSTGGNVRTTARQGGQTTEIRLDW
ncbi:hypothetical protein JX266_006964 [Neoarthrinium moseri]|nr:hypothetical protein JX266_006964 [Neoarthrinium moseri]